ncbi:hypothetical protein I3842_01G294600 [Carya illinoinensis]|uniref:Uncharacterized protein n=1 Tax=Carya illinoinensis TaxID=32201 RepID=A0A921ZYW1_CARIL|nr:hypothetical protein I3842_Q028000 [Carya illinoinensis]KAG6734939.1 hypothetical protein I3842_01G294600 [Carya illinoinensis]
MGMQMRFQLFFWLVMILALYQEPRALEAILSVTLNDHHRGHNLKTFAATLGIVCKCCDGLNGECRTTWDASCPKLKCLPWKLQ